MDSQFYYSLATALVRFHTWIAKLASEAASAEHAAFHSAWAFEQKAHEAMILAYAEAEEFRAKEYNRIAAFESKCRSFEDKLRSIL